MRIGVWNIDYAPNGKRAAIQAHLKEKNAGIWVLTETRTDILLNAAGPICALHSSGAPVERKSAQEDRWASIWTCNSIEEVLFPGKAPHEVSESELMNMRRRVCGKVSTADFGDLLIYAMVMPWPGSKKTEWSDALAYFSAEWKILKEKYRGMPLIVAGDFNTTFSEKIFPWEGAKALEDKLSKLQLTCATRNIADADTPMIDHIALPDAMKGSVDSATYWSKDFLSDHSGVVLEISK